MTRATLPSLPSQVAGREQAPTCPYVGLAPFTESDEAYFFGRERERDLVVANLTASRLTLLYAPSGVGKSSVLRAGLLPTARRLAVESLEDLGVPGPATVYLSEWSQATSETVAAAVVRAACAVPGASPFWPDSPRLDVAGVRAVLQETGVSALHLVLDQFEEYFLYQPEDSGETGLVADLAELLRARDLPVNVLLCLREDALAGLDRFKGTIPHLFENYLRLAPLDRSAGRAAILGPLEQYDRLVPEDDRMAVEAELVDRLLTEIQVGRLGVGGAESPLSPLPGTAGTSSSATTPAAGIEAPYLQLVLTRLWHEERAAGSSTLRVDTLDRLGGCQTVVCRHLDEVMSEFTPEQREVAAAVFQHLVTTSGSKIALTAGDLAEWSGLPVGAVRGLLEALSAGRQRILRPVPAPAGTHGPPRYEIYHDVMGAAVLDWRARHVAERDQQQAQRRLVEQREQAEAAARAARQRLRRTELVAAGMAVVLLVVAAVGVFGWRQAREARQQRLLAEAAGALRDDPARSLTAAVAAYDMHGDDDALSAVLTAASAPLSRAIAGGPSRLLLVTEDRTKVVAVAGDGGLRVLDDRGRRRAQTPSLRLTGTAVQGATTADARLVALTTDAGEAVVVDTRDGTSVDLPVTTTTPYVSLTRLGDRDLAVVTGDGQQTQVHDARSAALVARLGTVSTLPAISAPDGRHVVTADTDGRMRVWEPGTGRRVAQSDESTTKTLWHLQHDGTDIVAADGFDAEQTELLFWDGTNGSDLVRKPVDAAQYRFNRARVDADAGTIAVAFDKTAQVLLGPDLPWDALPTHADWVTDIASTAQGRWLATAGTDGRVLVWSRYAPNRPTYELLGHRGPVRDVSFLRGGSALVTLGDDGTVRFWELPDVSRYDSHTRWVLHLDTSPDGRWIVSADADGSVSVMDAEAAADEGLGQAVAEFELEHDVRSVRFDPSDPARLFVLPEWGSAVEIWQWEEGGGAERVTSLDPLPTGSFIVSFDVSPDGRSLTAGDALGRLHTWDVASGHVEDGSERVVGRGWVTSVDYDADGRRLVATTPELGRVWTADQPAPVELGSSGAEWVTFDPSGRRIAVAARGRLDLYSPDGQLQRRLTSTGGRLGRPAFSADGRLLTVGTAEGLIEVWTAADGARVLQSRVHGDSVNAVEFLPGDPSRLLSVSDDTTAALSPCIACVDPQQVLGEAKAWVAHHGQG